MSSSSTHLPTPEGPVSVSSAIGGAESWGDAPGDGIEPAADDVQTVVIPNTGHWVAEQVPEEMLAALIEFLAPYRENGGGSR
jgi:pimeloyl-ACP methyl ester carboxylesterase